MNIFIADDTPEVTDIFTSVIRRMGHTPIACTTLREADSIMDDVSRRIDIAFLDNHFKNEGFGIAKIRHYLDRRPEMDVVVTTKYPVKSDLVAEIVSLGVGFFKKAVTDPNWLEAEIAQRVNIRRSRELIWRKKMAELRAACDAGGEGVHRVYGWLIKPAKGNPAKIGRISRVNKELVVPGFELFASVGPECEEEVQSTFCVTLLNGLKAGTRMDVGLSLEDSQMFFKSRLGKRIRERLRKEFGIDEALVLQSTFLQGKKLRLSDDELQRGVRRKDFHRGVLSDVYCAEIGIECEKCGAKDSIELVIYVPLRLVEVSSSSDKFGNRIDGEDGRAGYVELKP